MHDRFIYGLDRDFIDYEQIDLNEYIFKLNIREYDD